MALVMRSRRCWPYRIKRSRTGLRAFVWPFGSRLRACWFLASLCVLVPPGVEADPLFDPPAAVVADNFLSVALARMPGDPQEPIIRKWTGPLRVGVAGRATERGLHSLNLHLHHLRTLTKLEISSGPDTNLFVIFAEDAVEEALTKYRMLTRQFFPSEPALEESISRYPPSRRYCFGFIGLTQHAITAGLLFVQRDRAPELVHACIVRELSRFTGLVGEIPGTAYSAFATNGVWLDLTPQDQLFLELLYDGRMQPGMTASEARAAAIAILADLGIPD